MTRSAIVIFNPRSGRVRERQAQVADFCTLMSARGFHVEARQTERPNHATELAREGVERNVDLIVANGGDGTLNEVLQGMVGSQVPLAVWPGGTANVLALDLNLPRTAPGVVDLIAQNHRERIHIGRAGNRYFFFTAGIGLDAEIIEAVNSELKRRVGKGAFWIAGFSHLVKWQPTEITLKIDGRDYAGTFAVVGNSFGYGGTLSITPHARLNEDVLDVCIFSGTSKLKYINNLIACLQRRHLELDTVTYVKTRKIEANSNLPIPVQADGELVGTLPMTFEIIPDALTLIVPPGTFK